MRREEPILATDDTSFTIYILRCGDGSLYTGLTRDMERRLSEHQAGRGGRYTRSHLPVEPVFQLDGLPDYAAACRVESYIKSLSRARKLAIVAEDEAMLERLWDVAEES